MTLFLSTWCISPRTQLLTWLWRYYCQLDAPRHARSNSPGYDIISVNLVHIAMHAWTHMAILYLLTWCLSLCRNSPGYKHFCWLGAYHHAVTHLAMTLFLSTWCISPCSNSRTTSCFFRFSANSSELIFFVTKMRTDPMEVNLTMFFVSHCHFIDGSFITKTCCATFSFASPIASPWENGRQERS